MVSNFYAYYPPLASGGSGGAVTSVNGQTGAVVITANSINAANVTLSNLTSPTSINQSLIPAADATYDLGTAASRWNNAYFAGSLSVGTYPTASGQGLVRLFDGSFPGIEFYSGGSNAWTWQTSATSLFTQNVGSGVTGMTTVEGHHRFNNASGTALLTIDGTTGTTISSPHIQLQDGSQGTSGQVWTSTDTAGTGAWMPASGGGSNGGILVVPATGGSTTLTAAQKYVVVTGDGTHPQTIQLAAIAGYSVGDKIWITSQIQDTTNTNVITINDGAGNPLSSYSTPNNYITVIIAVNSSTEGDYTIISETNEEYVDAQISNIPAGASLALSNLSGVAINSSLVFGTAAGSNPAVQAASAASGTAAPTLNLVGGNATASTTNSGGVLIKSGTSTGGNTGSVLVQTTATAVAGKSTGQVSLTTGAATGTGSTTTGSVVLGTGSCTNGGSGVIAISTGSSPNAGSGTIQISTGGASTASGSSSSGNFTVATGNALGTGSVSGEIALVTGISTAGSGPVLLTTGSSNTTTASGPITLTTGTAASGGNTGNITLITGAATGGGTNGKIQLQNGSQGTAGQIWTSTDTSGSGSWIANPALSGVATVQNDSPTTGGTVTIANGVGQEIITPAGSLLTLTVNLPSAPVNGQRVGIASTQPVTTLTLSGGSNTVDGGLTAFTANSFAAYMYLAATTTWYRVG